MVVIVACPVGSLFVSIQVGMRAFAPSGAADISPGQRPKVAALGDGRAQKFPTLKGSHKQRQRIVSPFQGEDIFWGLHFPGRCPGLNTFAPDGAYPI